MWKDRAVEQVFHIAIDGTAGSGKTTLAKALARRNNMLYIDTGLMYRWVAFVSLDRSIDLSQEEELSRVAQEFEPELYTCPKSGRCELWFQKENFTEKMHAPPINVQVPLVARIPGVRDALVKKQQEIARERSVVMVGRDIGTVVLPDAQLKLYVDAAVAVRAQRRYQELKLLGTPQTLSEVEHWIMARDAQDQGRENSPLTQAEGAHYIDTSERSIEEIVTEVEGLIHAQR